MAHTEQTPTFDTSTTLIEETSTTVQQRNEYSSLSVIISIRFVVGVVIIILNIAVICCVKKWTRLKRATRILFLNLAASDILFGVSTLFSVALIIPHADWMNDKICLMTYTSTTISRCACSTGIMLLAFDVFANTILFKTSNVITCVFKLYFIGSVVGLSWFPLFILGVWIIDEVSENDCNPERMAETTPGRVAVLVMVIQSLFSVLLYAITFSAAAHQIRKWRASINPENLLQTVQSIKRLQREMKIAKIAVALGVLYLLSHGPNIAVITEIVIFEGFLQDLATNVLNQMHKPY